MTKEWLSMLWKGGRPMRLWPIKSTELAIIWSKMVFLCCDYWEVVDVTLKCPSIEMKLFSEKLVLFMCNTSWECSFSTGYRHYGAVIVKLVNNSRLSHFTPAPTSLPALIPLLLIPLYFTLFSTPIAMSALVLNYTLFFSKTGSRDGRAVFSTLYTTWCHDPVSTIALCMIAHSYQHASDVIHALGSYEVRNPHINTKIFRTVSSLILCVPYDLMIHHGLRNFQFDYPLSSDDRDDLDRTWQTSAVVGKSCIFSTPAGTCSAWHQPRTLPESRRLVIPIGWKKIHILELYMVYN